MWSSATSHLFGRSEWFWRTSLAETLQPIRTSWDSAASTMLWFHAHNSFFANFLEKKTAEKSTIERSAVNRRRFTVVAIAELILHGSQVLIQSEDTHLGPGTDSRSDWPSWMTEFCSLTANGSLNLDSEGFRKVFFLGTCHRKLAEIFDDGQVDISRSKTKNLNGKIYFF